MVTQLKSLELIHMRNSTQNLIHLFIILVIALILFSLNPVSDNSPHGILLPSGPQFKAIPTSQVQITNTKPIGNYTLVGHIRISKHFGQLNKKRDEYNYKADLGLAKKLAAKAGANTLYVKTVAAASGEGTDTTSPLDGFVLYADALRAKNP